MLTLMRKQQRACRAQLRARLAELLARAVAVEAGAVQIHEELVGVYAHLHFEHPLSLGDLWGAVAHAGPCSPWVAGGALDCGTGRRRRRQRGLVHATRPIPPLSPSCRTVLPASGCLAERVDEMAASLLQRLLLPLARATSAVSVVTNAARGVATIVANAEEGGAGPRAGAGASAHARQPSASASGEDAGKSVLTSVFDALAAALTFCRDHAFPAATTHPRVRAACLTRFACRIWGDKHSHGIGATLLERLQARARGGDGGRLLDM